MNHVKDAKHPEDSVLVLRQTNEVASFIVAPISFEFIMAIVTAIPPHQKYTRALLGIVTLWCLISYISYLLHYLWMYYFIDHVEANILDTARLFSQGRPVYHDLDSSSRYSLLYGPNTYLLTRAGLFFFGETMIAFKLPSVLFALGSLALTIVSIWTSVKNSVSFYLGIIYYCGIALLFREKCMWVRSDPQIVFWVALGVFGFTRRSSFAASLILGLAMGGAFNTKIHTFLYYLPLLVLLLPRFTILNWVVMIATAMVMIVLPFALFPEISFQNYLAWLRISTKHGFDDKIFSRLIPYLGVVGLPAAVEMIRMLRSWSHGEWRSYLRANWAGLTLIGGAIFALLLISSKKGGGGHHLLPLVPLTAWFVATFHDRVKSVANLKLDLFLKGMQLIYISLCIVSVSIAMVYSLYLPRKAVNQSFREAIAELQDFRTAHENECISMGYGGDYGFVLTWLRPFLPIQDKFICDASALMDMNASGLAIPNGTLENIRSRQVKYWLLPRGEQPFTMISYYSNEALFPEEFRKVFLENYEMTGNTHTFDIWTCRK